MYALTCVFDGFRGRGTTAQGAAEALGGSSPHSDGEPVDAPIDKSDPCKFGEIFATNGRIAAFDLTVMKDDKQFFASYLPALTLRQGSRKSPSSRTCSLPWPRPWTPPPCRPSTPGSTWRASSRRTWPAPSSSRTTSWAPNVGKRQNRTHSCHSISTESIGCVRITPNLEGLFLGNPANGVWKSDECGAHRPAHPSDCGESNQGAR